MNEPVNFHCKQTIFLQDYDAFVKKTKSVKSIYIIGIVFIIMAVVGLVISFIDNDFSSIPILMFILGPIYMVAIPKNIAKQSYKEAVALNATTENAGIKCEVVFTENGIYDITCNSSRKYDYRQIIKIRETQEHLLLFITDNAAVIIRRDSFVFGDPSTLTEYISRKKA